MLINLWGDVPLITKMEVSDFTPSRTPQNQVLDFIISELEEAYSNLPENSNDYVCSKYFAKAIQARAYLYKKDYAKALECANIVIHSGQFSLAGDINSLYAGNCKESLFELPNSQEYSSLPYRELVLKGNYIAPVRYAEVLLMASEANMHLGNSTQAIDYLNQVRSRNGRTQLTNSTELETALLNEWKEDLKNEGAYFFALKRFDQAKQVLNIPDYKLLMPIPQRELDLNPSMTQNPGY